MAGLVPPELKQRFAERVSPHHGLKRARIGAVMDGQRVVQAPGRENWCYVTLTDPSDTSIAQALNLSTRWAWGVPVLVRPGPSGHLEVVGVDAAAASIEAGASAQILAVPNVAVTGIVDERRFEPGLVQAKKRDGAYTMSVYINSFVYANADGDLREYPGGWLDLTANVPGAGLRRLVLVGLNPTTNSATATNGPVYGLATALTLSQLSDIDPGGVIPLAAVNLAYGTTAINSESYIIDARAFLGGTTSAPAFLSLSDVTPTSYSGKSGQLVVVNAAETGLEFQAASGVGPFDVDLAPDSPSAYDDEFDDASIAVAWSEVDPDSKLTVAEAGGVLTLTMDQAYWLTYVSGPVGVSRPAPSGDFQVVTKVRLHQTGSNTTWGYVLLTFPTAGLLAGVSVDQSASFRHIELGVKDDPDGYFSSIDPAVDVSGAVDEWMYLRLRYDSVNKILALDYGADGLTWRVNATRDVSGIGEAPATVWLSVGCTATAVGDEATAEFEFFRVVESFGTSTDPIYGDYGAPLALDAGQVGYTPAAGADWADPDPTTVQGALDDLAARESGGAALTIKEADGTPSVSNVDTIVVTNGTLADDGEGQVTLDFGNAATDGSAIHDNEAGEIAAITEKETPVAADMLLIEDSEDDNAKKKVQIGNLPGGSSGGGLFTFTPPELADFAWVNQGAATATESNGRIYLYAPAVSGDQFRILKMTAPVTPYTVDIAFMPQLFNVDYNQVGFAWRQGSDGKIVAIQYAQNGSLAVHRFTNHTTWSAQAFAINTHMPKTPVVWYRMADNGTNRTVSWSVDGNNWIQLFSEGRTTFLTADEIGFYADSNNASYPAAMTLLSWKIT